MQKPNGYDQTTAGGDFTPINLGGHTAIIKRVKETTSKSGRPMIQIAIDFDSQDTQPNYFTQAFQNDDRPEKKWPYQGTHYILTEDNDGKCGRSFKSFITSVERSNNADCDWGPNFEKWFLNKKVGVVYGEVEEEYNGEIKTRRRIRWFCNYDKANGAQIPAKKMLQGMPVANTGFTSVPEGVDEEIPF